MKQDPVLVLHQHSHLSISIVRNEIVMYTVTSVSLGNRVESLLRLANHYACSKASPPLSLPLPLSLSLSLSLSPSPSLSLSLAELRFDTRQEA